MYYSKIKSFSNAAFSGACAVVLLAACGGGGGGDTTSATASDESESSMLANGGKARNTKSTDQKRKPVEEPSTSPSPDPAPSPTPEAPSGTDPTASIPGPSEFNAAYHLYVSTTGSDSNSGTQAAPFRTIQKAASVAQPSTVVHVAPGTYTGGFTTSKSGTANGHIYYVSDVKWGAKLVPGNSGSIAWKNTGNYTTISGFDIDGQNGTLWRIGVSMEGSYQTVSGNHLHRIWGSSLPCDSNGGGAIVTDGYDGQHHHYILNNQINHIAYGTGCNVSGIYLQGNTSYVKNNLVFAVTHSGIQAYHDATRADIANNTVFNCDRGIVLSANGLYHLKTAPDYFNVHNNIVYRNAGYGIVEASGPLGIGQNNSYRNNLSFGNGNANLHVTSGNQDSTSGNLFVDPQFVHFVATGGGNYQLTSSSPALDKGVSTYAPAGDINGVARPQGGGIDLGVYEYKPS